MRRYDAIVVGGGPAGSTTAYRLAAEGAKVLLADKATFPRDKPCGGGLSMRAVRQCPVDPSPVVEAHVDTVQMRFRYGDSVTRTASRPVIWMTQRRRLDTFLLDAARERGVEVREGARVSVEAGNIVVLGGDERVAADVVVGADGANGTTARVLDLAGPLVHGVALEGNVPFAALTTPWPESSATIELGDFPGGYGWVFPKGDHANVGVWTWQDDGPRLRELLARTCRANRIEVEALMNLRGHRLPMRGLASRIAGERALLVGDAAGLIDPVSGDGMYECFVSSKLAAAAILELLAGRATTLESYHLELERWLGRLQQSSWRIKRAFDRWPRTSWQLVRTKTLWKCIRVLIEGADGRPTAPPLPVRAFDVLGR